MGKQQPNLFGASEASAELCDLMARVEDDVRGAEAIDLFFYWAKTGIETPSAVLGGSASLDFSGGVGENSAEIRHHTREGLEFLGIARENGYYTSGVP